jgi:hypothetical protein
VTTPVLLVRCAASAFGGRHNSHTTTIATCRGCLVACHSRFRDIKHKRFKTYAPLPVRGSFCSLYCVPTEHHNIVGVRSDKLLLVSLLCFSFFSISSVSQLTARLEPYMPCRSTVCTAWRHVAYICLHMGIVDRTSVRIGRADWKTAATNITTFDVVSSHRFHFCCDPLQDIAIATRAHIAVTFLIESSFAISRSCNVLDRLSPLSVLTVDFPVHRQVRITSILVSAVLI